MTISGVHRQSTDELEPDDVHDILDAEDVAAELIGDADETPTTAMPSLAPTAAKHSDGPPRRELRELASSAPPAAAKHSAIPARSDLHELAPSSPPTAASTARSDPHERASSSPPRAARPPPSAAALAARLEQAEAELTRLRRHMRARDAYLAELEQALLASTTGLEASGIGSIEDAHKLFGRLRGQAFRIAELESELRNMEQRLSRLAWLLPNDQPV